MIPIRKNNNNYNKNCKYNNHKLNNINLKKRETKEGAYYYFIIIALFS